MHQVSITRLRQFASGGAPAGARERREMEGGRRKIGDSNAGEQVLEEYVQEDV